MIVLGIDPGYAIVGCGVVEYQSNRFRLLTYGAIITEAHTPFNERIEKIYDEADELMKRFHPEAMAIEKLFFNTNQKTAIDVAQARGALVLAAQKNKIPIFEYTPLQIKNSVAGYGRADKHQMIDTVTSLLGLREKPKPDDTADALAAAMCHAFTGSSRLAEYYNKPTTMAGKIGQTGRGSRSDIAKKLLNE